MAEGALGEPYESFQQVDQRVRTAVAFGSLALIVLGLTGILVSNSAISSTGLLLYALFGFGAAGLSALGYRELTIVAFASPLGLAFTLIVGTVLTTTGLWAIGPAIYWLVAAVSASVHIKVLIEVHRQRKSEAEFVRSKQTPENNTGRESLAVGRRVRKNSPSLATIVGVLSALGFLLCIASALAIRHLSLGWGGLLAAISPAWYIGLVALLTAILVGQRSRAFFAGIPVVALQLVLTGTPAIVYDQPRYAWTTKQVGVASYILLHGSTNPKIDIYQAWPGLFSGVAWICKVSAQANLLGVARWWSLVIDLATLLAVHRLALRVLRDPRRAWLAASVFVVGYAIADSDYFSSQSVGYFLAIAIFALVFRHRDDRSGMSASDWYLLVVMSIAVAVTHQLSPYMITPALIVMVMFGHSRTRWAPVVTFVPAAAWAYANLTYVSQHFSLRGLFNIFSNLTTPGIASGGPSPGQLANIVKYFQAGSALLIGLIALDALVRSRSRLHIFLACAASSAGMLTLANSYGNEAVFRVVLFALPWLAVLAGTLRFSTRLREAVVWSAILIALLPTYLMADMGLDFVNAGRTGDFLAIERFELTAPVGSYLVTIGSDTNSPGNLTGRYNEVNELSYLKVLGFTKSSAKSPSLSFGQFMSHFFGTISSASRPVIGTAPQFFVLTGEQQAASLATYGYASLKQYRMFSEQFAMSPLWELVMKSTSTHLYRLRVWPVLSLNPPWAWTGRLNVGRK
jgi:hypothetical protein